MNTYHPERYHGFNQKGTYFEGWFYKLVNAGQDEVFAFIPGIFLDPNPKQAHSFIQVLDGHHQATYHRFSPADFEARPDAFDIRVDRNRFQWTQLDLDLASMGRRIRGTVKFEGVKPWPVKWYAPGIMGPFGLLPFMQCYHGVCSLHHRLEGCLEVDGREVVFDGGIGYIEKDWGRAFPDGYVWMQSNHFKTEGVCLSASIAKIPFPTGAFRGFIIGLLLADGRLLKFTTYNGARLQKVQLTDAHVHFEVRRGKFRMEVLAERVEGGLLHAPYGRSMTERISETLRSTLQLRLWEHETCIFDELGTVAGLDVNGDSAWVADKAH